MNDVHTRMLQMFKTLSTLIAGANARAEDRVRDAFAIELIDQKIREADTYLRAAKGTLVTLIQRQRGEERQADALTARLADLTLRATQALQAGRDDLATEAAQAIATMDNELRIRRDTLTRLDLQVMRLRQSIDVGHRRIIDLKQGVIQARAMRREQDIQSRLNTTLGKTTAVEEAEELIARVLGRDDPLEQSEILRDIDRDLTQSGITDRLSDQGFGPASRTTAAQVLENLRAALNHNT